MVPKDDKENHRTDVTRSALIESLARNHPNLDKKDIELAVKLMLEQMSQSLQNGERIEIRGFGSFNLHFHPPRLGRNPRTGAPVALPGVYVPHFKAGKELRDRVNTQYLCALNGRLQVARQVLAK